MGTFELIFSQDDDRSGEPSGQKRLGSAVLLYNALWFNRVRWIVVFVFTILGLIGTLMPGCWKNVGLVPPIRWPWIMAGTLIMANILLWLVVWYFISSLSAAVRKRDQQLATAQLLKADEEKTQKMPDHDS